MVPQPPAKPGTYTVTRGGGGTAIVGDYLTGAPVTFEYIGTAELGYDLYQVIDNPRGSSVTVQGPPSKARNRAERRAERHAR